MHDFDTSVLVPLVVEKSASKAVERFMSIQQGGTLAVSRWNGVEFASMLAREVRMGGLDAGAARLGLAQFEAIIDRSFTVLTPGADDYNLARQYIGIFDTKLRADDALHLAIAANNRAEVIHSLDRALVRAGHILGLPVTGEL